MNNSPLAERLVVHWALQIPTAVATAQVPRAEDDSHSNFGWSYAERAFVSRSFGEPDARYRVGLRPETLELTFFEENRLAQTVTLAGRTLNQGLERANDWLRSIGAGAAGLRDYEMPDHPLIHGAPFPTQVSDDVGVLYERAFDTFSRAEHAIEESADRKFADRKFTVHRARVWPHHFDLGGLVTASGSERSLGYGLSPGDETFGAPYVYLNLYPAPEKPPSLTTETLRWNTQGFRGFVAPAAEFFAADPLQTLAESVVQCLPTLTHFTES